MAFFFILPNSFCNEKCAAAAAAAAAWHTAMCVCAQMHLKIEERRNELSRDMDSDNIKGTDIIKRLLNMHGLHTMAGL